MKQLFSFFLFLGLLMPIQAQVFADDNAVVSPAPESPSSSYVIKNFSVPIGDNVVLVVLTRNGGNGTVTNINFNSVNYTTNNIGTGSNGGHRSEIWAIPLGNIDPAITDKPITVTLSSAPGIHGAFAATFNNVNQATPANNFIFEADGDLSIDVTSSSGDMAIDLIGANSTPNFINSGGQTALIENALVSSDTKISGSYETGAGIVTMSWSNSGGSQALIHVGANIRSNGVLPVEMTNFRAWQSQDQVELAWTTASEVKNEGFEIEQKTTDTDWRYLDFVSGSGTSFEVQSYGYLHESPLGGMNYYRLKQLDFDGRNEYSPVVRVDLTNLKNESNLKIAPNPVTIGTLTLSLQDIDFETAYLEVFDSKGQRVITHLVTDKTLNLDVGNLAKGIYWLRIRTDGKSFSEKVIIE